RAPRPALVLSVTGHRGQTLARALLLAPSGPARMGGSRTELVPGIPGRVGIAGVGRNDEPSRYQLIWADLPAGPGTAAATRVSFRSGQSILSSFRNEFPRDPHTRHAISPPTSTAQD